MSPERLSFHPPICTLCVPKKSPVRASAILAQILDGLNVTQARPDKGKVFLRFSLSDWKRRSVRISLSNPFLSYTSFRHLHGNYRAHRFWHAYRHRHLQEWIGYLGHRNRQRRQSHASYFHFDRGRVSLHHRGVLRPFTLHRKYLDTAQSKGEQNEYFHGAEV